MGLVDQVTFEAGELAPKFHGRADLGLYKSATKTCRNFFPTLEGALVSRPGSMLVRETKGSATGGAANTEVRLIKFVFSGGQTYVLELGNFYVRFHANGGTVESAPGVPLEIVSPYSWSSLKSLQFAQVGNVMVLTHPGYDAYVLERLTHTSWTLTTLNYTPPATVLPTLTRTARPPFYIPGSSGYVNDLMIVAPFPTTDASHPPQEWIWAYTVLAQDIKTGRTFETTATRVTRQFDGTFGGILPNPTIALLTTNKIAIPGVNGPVTLRMDMLQPGGDAPYFIKAINIYRGRGNLLGLVGQTTWYGGDFVDVGSEPNYLKQPPLGQNPFQVFDTNGSLLRTEKPMAVAFYKDRLAFGGAYDNSKLIRVATLFFSATGQWDRFDKYLIPAPTDSLEYELAVNTRQEIRTLLSHQKLLVGTDAGVHSFWGSGGDPISPATAPDVRHEANVGCSHLRMLTVRGVPIFMEGAQADGVGSDGFAYGLAVHALHFTDGYAGYSNQDISTQASHLFFGDGGGITRWIRDWDYAAKPWQLVWAVRRDGVLLSLTYDSNRKVAGWARHDTDGTYENVCTVPEGTEDAVYAVVNRTVNGVAHRYIERFTSRSTLGDPLYNMFATAITQHADYVCVDSAKYYFGAPASSLTGLSHLEGKNVYVIGPDLNPIGPLPVVAGTVQLGFTPAANVQTPYGGKLLAYVGLYYRPELETLSVGGAPEKQKTLKGLLLWVKDTKGLLVGSALEDNKLKPAKQLNPAIGYGAIPAATRVIRVATTGTWDEHARAAVRQQLPLPATIVRLTREVELGG